MSLPPDPRPSDVPLAIEMTGSASIPQAMFGNGIVGQIVARIPPQYLGLTGYLVAGIFLGLVLILALSIGNGGSSSEASAAATTTQSAANAVTDNVTRLHAREIGESCWSGISNEGPARLTVSLEVGTDGHVRYAAAAGESASMRSCVEAHVRSWEFLPQAQTTAMALPFEVDRR